MSISYNLGHGSDLVDMDYVGPFSEFGMFTFVWSAF